MTLTTTLLFSLLLSSVSGVTQQEYKMPPSQRTIGSVSVISDKKMEECVKLFNEANWLAQKLDVTIVNSYSESEVSAYNTNVMKYETMIDRFNSECAGKQSRSACEATQKLNREQGLQTQSCD